MIMNFGSLQNFFFLHFYLLRILFLPAKIRLEASFKFFIVMFIFTSITVYCSVLEVVIVENEVKSYGGFNYYI